MRCLREKSCAFLLVLYMLAGRWSVLRLFAPGLSDAKDAFSLYQMLFEPRTYCVVGLILVTSISRIRPPRPYMCDSEIDDDAQSLIAFCLGCFFLYTIVASAWAVNLLLAEEKAVETVFQLVVILTLYWGRTAYDFEVLLNNLFLFLAFFGGILVLAALVGRTGGEADGRPGISVLGGGPNIFGRNLALSFWAAVYFVNQSESRAKLFWQAAQVIFVVMVLASGSRGAMIALMISFGAYYWLRPSRIFWDVAVLSIIGGMLILIFGSTEFGASVIDIFQERFLRRTLETQYLSHRDVIWEYAFKLGMENPLIGSGLNAVAANSEYAWAHNLFLETWSDSGLFGIAFLFLYLATFIYLLWRDRAFLEPSAVGIFIVCLVAAQFSGDLFDSRSIFLMSFLIIASVNSTLTSCDIISEETE